ncbi:pyridoxamine 5'-phosphate oxidase family protein [Tessaracoccus oleiagri]|uniref:Pyridoxamine 5'-phosphate oxidase n=1 Tax=Tessaracoccus oleiagri TaxID=686624 RepID=A0A1G9L863_9ACTN|nr:pyridoxamine 5'-phosphate oxidase family protein [Tessaracoccus oleiagri]SDL58132.1 Pyridoxamine 5'-phosphate oxidase [Tessaracoccus oleiagri]
MENDEVTYFSPIPEEECRSLLGSVEFGRVAWTADDGVMVLPVNFQLVDGHVVFHTAQGSTLAKIADGANVAFQADEIDPDSAIGWSVLLRGTTRQAPANIPAHSWMSDERSLGVMIEETSLSGRVISGRKREQS